MRIDRISACLCLLAWSSALVAWQSPTDSAPTRPEQTAQPQSPPTSSATATSPASASAQPPESTTATASASSPVPVAAPAATPAAAPATATQTANVTDALADKRLRSQGWKRKVRNGEVVYCKDEEVLGTRFPKTICGPPDMLKEVTRQSRDWTDDIQQNKGNSNPATCPNGRC